MWIDILKFLKENLWDPPAELNEEMETIKRKMEVLISRRDDVMDAAEDAKLHSSKGRKREVDNWLRSVQKLENKFSSFEQQVEQSCKIAGIWLSDRADKIHKELEDLLEQDISSEGILLNVNEVKVLPLVTTALKGQALVQNLKEVVESLSKVSSIGIWGMGGVGKTTLAMHIHDHLLKDSRLTSNVYWITVSQDFGITKLQSQIAKCLKLDLSTEDDDKKRAASLCQSLMRVKSFVLILDDVWTHFDVEKVGIPLETDGGKLIITSRSVEVCDKIGCKKKVKVGVLSPSESWELFVETLGHSGDLPMEIEEIAKRMTKKCDGLPLGLITMAASMRGVNDVSEWRNAFKEFAASCMQMENMNNEVFPVLCFSYNRLKDPTLQKCFLYCCLYPEDFKIERYELICLFIVEGLLDERNNRAAKFDQGHAVLNKLERACLLESVWNHERKNSVRMHDLVRQMALHIARDEFKWMVKAGAQLHEIPREQEWSEDLDKVSLMHNDIKEISQPLSNVCPRLTTFSLRGNSSLSQVVDPFLVQMPGLRVLDLSYTAIQQLPSSVSNLVSLSALLLRYCRKLRFLPPLHKLKNLNELDLFYANINEFPQGLASLVNLRRLDMRTKEKPFNKPAVDILATLSNLQSLSIHFAVRVEELSGMRQLEVFHGVFVDVCSFNGFVKHRQSCGTPSFFEIALDLIQSSSLGFYFIGYDNKVILSGLVLTGDNVEMLCYDRIEEEQDVTLLPLDTQELGIDHCDILTLGNSLLDAIPSLIQSKDLRVIKIERCKGIEFLMRLSYCSSMGERMMGDYGLTSTCNPFLSLERLGLSCLDKFSGLVKLEFGEDLPPVGTFSHLRELHVYGCHKMKKLIPRWLLQYLLNLTEIEVGFCSEMEEIITEDEEEQAKQCVSSASSSSPFPSNESRSIKDDEVVLPKLQSVHLHRLPELKSIYKGRMTCHSIQSIIVWDCQKLKRLPFTLPLLNGQPSAPPALQRIYIDYEKREALEWDHPEYKNVLHPFFIFPLLPISLF